MAGSSHRLIFSGGLRLAVFGWGLRVLVMVRVRVGAGSSGMICHNGGGALHCCCAG